MENYERNVEKLTFNQTGPDVFDELFEKSLKDKLSTCEWSFETNCNNYSCL